MFTWILKLGGSLDCAYGEIDEIMRRWCLCCSKGRRRRVVKPQYKCICAPRRRLLYKPERSEVSSHFGFSMHHVYTIIVIIASIAASAPTYASGKSMIFQKNKNNHMMSFIKNSSENFDHWYLLSEMFLKFWYESYSSLL